MISELTDFQMNVLLGTANGPSRVCAIILPKDTDEQERKDHLTEQVKAVDELIALELMKDISEEFTEQIKLAKLNHKVDSRVVIITERAELLFRDCGTRSIN